MPLTIARAPERTGEFVEGLWIDSVFLFQDTRCKGAHVVARKDGHARPGKDRTRVNLSGHEVNGAAMFAEPLGQSARVGVEAAQIWQQRGMDVEHPSSPPLDEGWA